MTSRDPEAVNGTGSAMISRAHVVAQAALDGLDACIAVVDPTGNGQGQTFLGAAQVMTDASGNATFSATVAAPPAGGGAFRYTIGA